MVRARVRRIEFAQIDEEASVHIALPGRVVQDFEALGELITLQIKLGKVAVPDQGGGHLADGSTVGFDGHLFFSQDGVNTAQLGEEDAWRIFLLSGLEQYFAGFLRFLELKQPLRGFEDQLFISRIGYGGFVEFFGHFLRLFVDVVQYGIGVASVGLGPSFGVSRAFFGCGDNRFDVAWLPRRFGRGLATREDDSANEKNVLRPHELVYSHYPS